MAKPGKSGLMRIVCATGCSAKGLQAAWKYESAFRQEVVLLLLLQPLALLISNGFWQYLLLLLAGILVLLAEIINSAIEAIVDRIGPEYHPLSGRAKDLGSAAVFVAILMNALLWGALAGHNLLGWW